MIDSMGMSRSVPRPAPVILIAVVAAMLCRLDAQPLSAGEWPVDGPAGVQLAWREDPRIPGDGLGGPTAPAARGPSRRAQRRAVVNRRRLPEDPAEQFPGGPDDDPFMRCHPQDVPPICPLPNRLVLPLDSRGGWPTVTFPAPEAAPGVDSTSPPVVAEPGSPGPFRWAGSRGAAGGGIVSHRDEPYAPGAGEPPGRTATARHRFDMHKPAGAVAGGLPLVIWIPGDSWRDVARGDCPIAWLAEEGYAVASIGYRSSDVAAFPAQIDDCRAAIAAIVRHADAWGVDPGRIVVAGAGGGGHLAALVALGEESAAEPGWPGVAAVCAVGAPTNLATLGPEHDRSGSAASRLIGGPLPEYREKARFASPITHVTPDDPPVLIVHGAADSVVSPRQAFEFDTALKAAGVDSALVILPGVGHRPALGRGTPAGQSLLAFLGRTIGPGDPVSTGSDAAGPPP